MDGEKRRKQIVATLTESKDAVSGNALAKILDVSRQVIVQDIALIRATNKNILSTNKGYILQEEAKEEKCRNIISVKHNNEQIRDELYTIVDEGGVVLDVVVEHEVYGQISVDLIIKSRKDVDDFVEKSNICKTKPLKELTDDIHYHTIEAENEEIICRIIDNLKQKGYLIF